MPRTPARGALTCLLVGLFALLSLPVASAETQPPPSQWKDVQQGSRAWFAHGSIDRVAADNAWMRDYGKHWFHPTASETRARLARAVVRAFAPDQEPNGALEFSDVPPNDPYYPYVNVAVSNGWMTTSGAAFGPDDPVDEYTVSRALVFALGLRSEVNGANAIHLHDGTKLKHPGHFGVLLIGRVLGLWYNHNGDVKGDSEAYDILPTQEVPRDDVAWALARAASLGDSAHWYADQYADLDVGMPSEDVQKVIEFGMKYVGYPYIYAGEWNTASTSGSCCGSQLQGGFDCSGLTWWLLKAPDSGYDNTAIRKYEGWILPQRASYQMAGAMKPAQRVPFAKLRPGDIMLYGTSKNPSSINHVDTYIGNGWALDSGGNGVSIVNVSDGWYRDSFQYGRHLAPATPSN